MATLNAMLRKLNHTSTYRLLQSIDIPIEYPPFSSTEEEEKELIRVVLFTYLKKRFRGAKIRQNTNSFSVRLDSAVNRNADNLRSFLRNEREWRSWLNENHSNLYRIISNDNGGFQTDNSVRIQRRDDKQFLYVPFNPSSIYRYDRNGLTDMIHHLENQWELDEKMSAIFDEVTSLIETEIARREEENARKLRRELESYKAELHRRLFKRTSDLHESDNPIDRLFAQKFETWAAENRVAPSYVVEATADEMAHQDLKVQVLSPKGSEEEGWVVIPPFAGHPEAPENYEVQGWGRITKIDREGERSRGGTAPIVVAEHLYLEFDLNYWSYLLPENYSQLLEVSKRLYAEAQDEVEPFLAEERRAQERAAQQEAERQAAEAEESVRARQAREAARQQRHGEVIDVSEALEEIDGEEVEEVAPSPDFVARLRQQVQETPAPDMERANTYGLYRNSQAIPLEQFVAIRQDGTTRRFSSPERARQWLNVTSIALHNYHQPFEQISVIREP